MEKYGRDNWGRLTPEVVMRHLAKLRTLFPELRVYFYQTLIDKLVANDFTDEEFIEAYKHVISGCAYPPTIAHFIQFQGKKVRTDGYGMTADEISILYDRIHDN